MTDPKSKETTEETFCIDAINFPQDRFGTLDVLVLKSFKIEKNGGI